MTDKYRTAILPVGEPPPEPQAQFEVKTMRGIIELRPRWWRHPIRWWKMRHFLPDVEQEIEEGRRQLGPERFDELRAELDRRLEDTFLNGTGEQS